MKKPILYYLYSGLFMLGCALMVNDAIGQPKLTLDLVKAVDYDNDGVISIKEAVSYPPLLAVFAQLDKNEDGEIDFAELAEADKQGLL